MKELKLEEGDIKRIFRLETPAVRFFRFLKRFLLGTASIAVLFGVFFVALNYSAFWQRFQFNAKAEPTVVVPKEQPKPIVPEQPDYAPAIEIAKIGVAAPLILSVEPDAILDQLKNGVTHYQATAFPGEIGNSVIVGHSSDFPWSDGRYKTVFALLDKLVAGDQIIVAYKKQRLIYTVSSTKVVPPTDLSVLRRTDTPQLTLLTCYPVGTTRSRLIVTARLTGGTPTGTQLDEPAINSTLPRPR